MEQLVEVLTKRFPGVDFEKEKKLYSDSILDSLALMEVVTILADRFGVTVTMDYMDPENFESVETIWNMMQELK